MPCVCVNMFPCFFFQVKYFFKLYHKLFQTILLTHVFLKNLFLTRNFFETFLFLFFINVSPNADRHLDIRQNSGVFGIAVIFLPQPSVTLLEKNCKLEISYESKRAYEFL